MPPGPFDALVFTSETGVEAFRRLSAGLRGVAWCVGLRTAAAARAAGFVARDGGGDARTMARRILAARPGLSVLVVRGRDQAVDVSEALAQGGATPQDLIVYAQEVQALNDAARALLQAEAPVVAPLFSARTAAHLAALPDIAGRRCALRIAALSPAVADAARPARPERIVIAARPEADALIAALAEWYGTERQP